MRFAIKFIAIGIFVAVAGAALGQQNPSPRNVVQLSASAVIEVPQDWLQLVMNTSREGTEAQAVQTQLKGALDAALKEARAVAETGALQVRTGNFALAPRRNRDGQISGWQGTAELLLEGRDFARISTTASRIQSLTVARVAFSLSREQQAQMETQVQALAIERFKTRAAEIARGFGFASYELREVTISTEDASPPRPRMMALASPGAMAEAALPVEAGKGMVQATVSGSVQLK